MTEWLIPVGHSAALGALELDHVRVPEEQQVDGAPTTGYRTLGSVGAAAESSGTEGAEVDRGAEVGVWEMSVGAMSDTEVDEVFVVLAGEATIEFVDEDRTITIGTGDFVRLAAGSRTIWTVLAPLRKLYITL